MVLEICDWLIVENSSIHNPTVCDVHGLRQWPPQVYESVTGRNEPDSILAVSFTLTFAFYCFCYKFITKRMLSIA